MADTNEERFASWAGRLFAKWSFPALGAALVAYIIGSINIVARVHGTESRLNSTDARISEQHAEITADYEYQRQRIDSLYQQLLTCRERVSKLEGR